MELSMRQSRINRECLEMQEYYGIEGARFSSLLRNKRFDFPWIISRF